MFYSFSEESYTVSRLEEFMCSSIGFSITCLLAAKPLLGAKKYLNSAQFSFFLLANGFTSPNDLMLLHSNLFCNNTAELVVLVALTTQLA